MPASSTSTSSPPAGRNVGVETPYWSSCTSSSVVISLCRLRPLFGVVFCVTSYLDGRPHHAAENSAGRATSLRLPAGQSADCTRPSASPCTPRAVPLPRTCRRTHGPVRPCLDHQLVRPRRCPPSSRQQQNAHYRTAGRCPGVAEETGAGDSVMIEPGYSSVNTWCDHHGRPLVCPCKGRLRDGHSPPHLRPLPFAPSPLPPF